MNRKLKILAVFVGVVFFAGGYYRSGLFSSLGHNLRFDASLFSMWIGNLIIGFFVGSYVYERPIISREEIAETVRETVNENMRDLTSRVLEELRKDRTFKRVKPSGGD